MPTIEQLLEAVRQLSDADRIRLVQALQSAACEPPFEPPRRDTMSSWLGLAGQFHSEFTDVSTDKYRHLAHVYADER